MPKVGIGVIGQPQSIGIDRPGSDVENCIDELCRIVPETLSRHLSPMIAPGLRS